MEFPRMTRRKAGTIGNGVFLIGIGVLFFINSWWPEILFVIGLSAATRQFLTARKTDFLITIGILAVLLIITLLHITPSMLLSILFIVLGIYLIGREYFFSDSLHLNHQINTDHKEEKNGRTKSK
ncbi:MAG: hypothetical protein H0W88_03775 [Parachlamydiaceae bacterium]|nr:hypothetical protein [Parachlamydiaceae bacterium]